MKAQTSASFTCANGAARANSARKTSPTTVADRRSRRDAGKVERNTVRSLDTGCGMGLYLRPLHGIAIRQYSDAGGFAKRTRGAVGTRCARCHRPPGATGLRPWTIPQYGDDTMTDLAPLDSRRASRAASARASCPTSTGCACTSWRPGSRPDRPCVLLLHGFPELAYSWRRVMPALADAGYHVVAPDLRGYGRTTGWHADYDSEATCARSVC